MSVPFHLRIVLLGLIGFALQAASPAPSKVPLGRANPFKPLIVTGQALTAPTAPMAPLALPAAGDAPVLPPPAVSTPPPDLPKFVAIAWDADEGQAVGAVAALRVAGRTRFVRVGEVVGRDKVVAITREAVTLRSSSRTLILPLSKR